ncbi:MAG: hypothetical protein HY011_13065 [Acidobacteria bacterium]|nr:hypothetical protein [Acidobacteriota bacterium]
MRPFFDGQRMSFVARDDVHLVAFDFARQDGRGFALDHITAQLRRHLLDVILVEVQFLCDL